MKELERTKRISISAVLFLLVVLIAVLTFKKPEHVFQNNTANTLEALNKKDYILTKDQLSALDNSTYVLIDIRDSYEYAKGHMKGAINITAHDVFESKTKGLMQKLTKEGKLLVIYAENPDLASGAWMLLYQLGYENAKILSVTTHYTDNKFIVDNYNLEKAVVNYAQVMKKATSASDKPKNVEAKKPTPKKVLRRPKKKKRVPEGGC